MINEQQDFRYMLKGSKLVIMTKEEEYHWLYDLLVIAVNQKTGVEDPTQKKLYTVEKDGFQKLQLKDLVEIAMGLGIDCEAVENNPRFFHLQDKFGNNHGFDVEYFESRDPKILNSFANIITNNFECGNAKVVPISMTTYPDSKLGDAIILIYINPELAPTAEIIDYTHPDYKRIIEGLGI